MELTRIRLSILSILLVLTLRCSGVMETEIDWTRCFVKPPDSKGETVCYVAKKCAGPDLEEFAQVKKSAHFTTPDVCDTGIQIKPYSRMKWLVYMQVKESQLDPDEGMWLSGTNDRKLFGCKKSANEKYFGITDLKIETYANVEEVFTTDRIFCSFTIAGIKYLEDILKNENEFKARFKFGGVKKEYDMDDIGKLIIDANNFAKCDPDTAQFDEAYTNDELIRHKIPITDLKINQCPPDKGQLYVKYPDSGSFVESTNVECKFESGGYRFVYTKKEGSSPVTIPTGAQFKVHCAAKACAMCETIKDGDRQGTCTPATLKSINECRVATCPTTQENWEYKDKEGKKGILVTSVTCKKKKNEENAGWFIDLKNGEEVEVDQAWCSPELDCATLNPLKYECPPGLKDIAKLKETKTVCVQPNTTTPLCGDGLLRVQDDQGAVEVADDAKNIVKTISCNKDTGKWMVEYNDTKLAKKDAKKGSFVFCATANKEAGPSKGEAYLYVSIAVAILILGAVVGLAVYIKIRRYKKWSESEREQRKRPRGPKWKHRIINEKLRYSDLSEVKEWTDDDFQIVLGEWLKYSPYERYKFTERIGFELGCTTNCTQLFILMARIFEVDTDYRVWQIVLPVFKLLHAQSADKENNLDVDKRMRKWCVSLCKPILERVGWDGCNNEFREQAYIRYIVFNLMYYCEDKDFLEKLGEYFDKGSFHLHHSINRQISWAFGVRDRDQFEAAKLVAEEAIAVKRARREVEERRAKAAKSSGGFFSRSKSSASTDASFKSTKSQKTAPASAKDKKSGSKEAKSQSKESKSQGGSNKSNKSNRSNKSGKEKKGSKETPSGKAKKKKEEGSKEASKSDKSGKSGKDKKKEKGGSKEAGKGKGRDKAGADEIKGDSGKEKNDSEKDKKKEKSNKSNKSNKSSKEKKSGKDKKKDSSKEKKEEKSGKEKTAQSDKSGKSGKSGKSSKEKKDGSKKSSKEPKTITAIDKSSKSKKSVKSTKSTKAINKKKKKNTKIGLKERRDADGDKLHGDRGQHIFFAIGSSRNKEQIASFLDYYIDKKEYFDGCNLVYLFQAALEWDDTRSFALDLFLNMNREVWKMMPPTHKYHQRILKNMKRYLIGEIDLQKLQSHITKDRNYNKKTLGKIDVALILSRIQNNVAFQPTMVEDLDKALKKLNF